MSKDFLTALKNRRSYYAISKDSVISDERIQEIVKDAVKYTPSSFNSQSARAVVLLGEQHDKLWNITEGILKEVVGDEQAFKSTAEKMASFRAGYGTVLFFEDNDVIAGLQQNFALYADNFPVWANQSNGMLQLVVWTMLEAEGLGASLQHYNPLIDEKVKAEWNIPENWKLIAQMPFGKPAAEPGDKEFAPLEDRVKVYK
ncbi:MULTISPECIES: nitroreductase family protein [Paenibacillus]|jgi:predicted oxidoreductase (fatty acid repression mutant protein)|uniref:Oxidoreductase (Fatty acid repression mutant protein) n=1 Tax=Paenibacillus lactis TaxID=228574 RepID=A0ABS4FAE4_9BACL|nr:MULTISPECIES: nitroreductase family protein [Paenibacillus]MBP1893225.1 putative oxidoreductase (fatty acid repression mutant protein) [Paenibacillus lactis]MCM3496453.1 nitroreductase family protein [Paenibacillus lactis]GIO90853.1 nitroreductase [Paenibacillus lactis]HAG01600.1 nitroreductase [Paenibacillus lactis]